MSDTACVGNCFLRLAVIVGFILFMLGFVYGITSDEESDNLWFMDWILAWVYWFAYHPLIFGIYYYREEPCLYTKEDKEENVPFSVSVIESPSNEQITEWAHSWVERQCCYGECEFMIKEVKSYMTKRCKVSSFQEHRCKMMCEEPYEPGRSYINWGVEPDEWDMKPEMGPYWMGSENYMEVPNT
eukprot:UN31320